MNRVLQGACSTIAKVPAPAGNRAARAGRQIRKLYRVVLTGSICLKVGDRHLRNNHRKSYRIYTAVGVGHRQGDTVITCCTICMDRVLGSGGIAISEVPAPGCEACRIRNRGIREGNFIITIRYISEVCFRVRIDFYNYCCIICTAQVIGDRQGDIKSAVVIIQYAGVLFYLALAIAKGPAPANDARGIRN